MLELHLFVNKEEHVGIIFFHGKSKEGSIVLVLPGNLFGGGVVESEGVSEGVGKELNRFNYFLHLPKLSNTKRLL